MNLYVGFFEVSFFYVDFSGLLSILTYEVVAVSFLAVKSVGYFKRDSFLAGGAFWEVFKEATLYLKAWFLNDNGRLLSKRLCTSRVEELVIPLGEWSRSVKFGIGF